MVFTELVFKYEQSYSGWIVIGSYYQPYILITSRIHLFVNFINWLVIGGKACLLVELFPLCAGRGLQEGFDTFEGCVIGWSPTGPIGDLTNGGRLREFCFLLKLRSWRHYHVRITWIKLGPIISHPYSSLVVFICSSILSIYMYMYLVNLSIPKLL